jgi:hypothetical protein
MNVIIFIETDKTFINIYIKPTFKIHLKVEDTKEGLSLNEKFKKLK